MSLQMLLVWLVIGAIAGWLAGEIVRGHGFGLGGNIVVGIVGAIIAGGLLPRLNIGIGNSLLSHVVFSAIGAVVLLVLLGLLRKL